MTEGDLMRQLDDACLRLSYRLDKVRLPSMDRPWYSQHTLVRKGDTLLVVKGK